MISMYQICGDIDTSNIKIYIRQFPNTPQNQTQRFQNGGLKKFPVIRGFSSHRRFIGDSCKPYLNGL